jgi:hypothetical protein
MKDHIKKLVIASDGWPLEQIQNRPIINFFRRLLHGKYRVCEECWRRREEDTAKSRASTPAAPNSLKT